MKTLAQAIEGVTLPFQESDADKFQRFHFDTSESIAHRVRNRKFAIQASNAFPNLVQAVLASGLALAEAKQMVENLGPFSTGVTIHVESCVKRLMEAERAARAALEAALADDQKECSRTG